MISIITVNFNGYLVTTQLLDSLRSAKFNGEIIVVDNGSVKDEASELKKNYPEIIAIRSNENLGFAGGNNLGIKEAKGDILLLLNNDTTIIDKFDKVIEEFFNNHPQAGVVAPKIKFEYAPDTIQFAGYTELHKITLRNQLIGCREKDIGQYDNEAQTPYVLGAAMAIRKCVIDDVGLMPECYFLYYEELDWCIRIREHGWQIWYTPKTVVYHKESWSTGGHKGVMKTYYITRNRIKFAKRNLKGLTKIISITYQFLIVAPVNIARSLRERKPDVAIAIMKAILNIKL